MSTPQVQEHPKANGQQDVSSLASADTSGNGRNNISDVESLEPISIPRSNNEQKEILSDSDKNSHQEAHKDKDTSLDQLPSSNNSGKDNEIDPNLDELSRLHLLCEKLVDIHRQSNLPSDAASHMTDSILRILTTDDLLSIRSTTALHSFFIDHLKRLPPKIVSELLSVLIAVLKKSVFNLDAARGLLVPCIYQILHSNDSIKNDQCPCPSRTTSKKTAPDNGESLMKHFLREWINLLISHTCDVKELKSIVKFSEYDSKLLNFVRYANLNQRNRPHAFFAFPGTRGSMIALSPFQKWPTQNGWSFSTWFCIEPKVNNSQPYLFCFKTSKTGLGYSAHFTGNCLVLTSMKVKGKGVQHCVAYEFQSYKWVYCAITYISKWRASEIKVYVNGQLSASIEMAWQVQTNEVFDKCFIGGSGSMSQDRGELNSFCGQMSAVYLFNESLTTAQICAIHRLGPSYMGQFKYSNESQVYLPSQISKVLYEEKLSASLFCLYTPVAVDGGTLCLQSAPLRSSTSNSAQNFFMSSPHAALLGQTKAIVTQPICSTLQSIGCARSLFPLLNVFASKGDAEACSTLIGFLCDLLECSPHWFANEIIQSHGFVIIACSLTKNARQIFTQKILDIFLNLTRTLITASKTAGDSLQLKHLMDNILFNPALWIYVDAKLQINLYSYLATEFLHGTKHVLALSNSTMESPTATVNQSSNSTSFISAYTPTTSASAGLMAINQQYASSSNGSQNLQSQLVTDQSNWRSLSYDSNSSSGTDFLFGEIRRVSTVLQSLHALKYYYWLAEEKDIQLKAKDTSLRPNYADLCKIRSHILLFVKELILRSTTVPHDELQGILNYLSTVNNDENLLDVLNMLESLMNEYPATLIPAFDSKQGVKVIFKLISSPNEDVRVQALRLLGLFLSKSTQKRKQDVMGPYNLFMLLCENLKKFTPLSFTTYRALYQILIESTTVLGQQHQPTERQTINGVGLDQPTNLDYNAKIENPMILKVIASLIIEGKKAPSNINSTCNTREPQQKQSLDIRSVFINDLWNLIVNSRENRRTVLQMSVWQHWLINLIDFDSNNSELLRDQILAIFRVLLYHAIRYEYGGWRVWIDTLAIIHTKVSYDDFIGQFANLNMTSLKKFDVEPIEDEYDEPPGLDDKASPDNFVNNINDDSYDDDLVNSKLDDEDNSIIIESQTKSILHRSATKSGESAIQSLTSSKVRDSNSESYNDDQQESAANLKTQPTKSHSPSKSSDVDDKEETIESPTKDVNDDVNEDDNEDENEAKSLNVHKLDELNTMDSRVLDRFNQENKTETKDQSPQQTPVKILADNTTMESIDLDPAKPDDDSVMAVNTEDICDDNTIQSPSHVISISERIHKEESANILIKQQQSMKKNSAGEEDTCVEEQKDGQKAEPDETEAPKKSSTYILEDEAEEINLDDDEDTNPDDQENTIKKESDIDTVDLAPTREFRKILTTDHVILSSDNEDTQFARSASIPNDDENVAVLNSAEGTVMEEEDDENISVGSPLQENSTNDESTGTTLSQESTPSNSSQQHHLHHHDIVNQTSKQLKQQQTPCSLTDNVQRHSHNQRHHRHHQDQHHQAPKISATPAFRIPEFKWSHLLIKLLNDLMFSIECDLFHWKCLARQVDQSSLATTNKHDSGANRVSGNIYQFNPSGFNRSANDSGQGSQSTSPTPNQMDHILQNNDNQIYIVNIIHFVSQLCDNIVIASGGLLPLLAEATGGKNQRTGNSSTSSANSNQKQVVSEGLTMSQANSLLYRLVNLIDTVVFSASHVNLSELEADKNTTNGGILRQCLRLSCTVAVKNCLTLQAITQRITSMGIGGNYAITSSDFPRDLFDNYHGCSIVSASELFVNSALRLDQSDLLVDGEFSPHQTPNTGITHSFLPFQSVPIKDPNKLLQTIDVNRIQAAVYRDQDPESRQSQFLALASLYFISVLMVSKYRDIIEPKRETKQQQNRNNKNLNNQPEDVDIGTSADHSISCNTTSITSSATIASSTHKCAPETQSQAHIVTESDHYTISNQTSNPLAGVNDDDSLDITSGAFSSSTATQQSATSSISEMLTTRLETTLSSVCPLLIDIMCDFSMFLSKTLLGSYGQDLVSKEADRTFRKPNTSPVELVMLLCSQEWQNTLQKNAGLTFIELINEGRILSHGMKDHIVRVAMEAEFILNRLRADDVAKHEQFNLSCVETQSTRMHEEALVNSLICSAKRRDYVLHNRFKETSTCQNKRNYKLDNWEDDDRRRRRFIVDTWDDDYQLQYHQCSSSDSQHQNNNDASKNEKCLSRGSDIDCCDGSGDSDPVNMVIGDADNETPKEDMSEVDHRTIADSMDEENHKRNNGDLDKTKTKFSPEDDDLCLPTNESANKNKQQDHKSTKCSDNMQYDSRDSSLNHDRDDYYWEMDDQNVNFNSDCEPTTDFSGSVLFATECSLIWNIYAIDGILQLTAHELYFEPHQAINDTIDSLKREAKQQQRTPSGTRPCNSNSLDNQCSNTNNVSGLSNQNKTIRKLDLKVLKYCEFLAFNGKIMLTDIRAIFSRHYLLQQNAIEIFLIQRTSVMFAFNDFDTVKRVIKFLPPVGVGIKYGIQQTRRASLISPRQLFASSNMTQKWQKREISNFQYLMFLNTIAGRTFQDLNQYPVFPWILTNYDSEQLDLALPTNFRDLSKPVGALNNDRRLEFIERYQNWDNPKVPAFHYGTHYSTAAFTLSWMSRLRGQFNTAYMALQDGKYEDESRLFLSIGDAWMGSLVGGQQNVKELIPEFYYLPEIFYENFGLRAVELPPWAESAEHFVRLHRMALESELVSCQLHQWIDLIFGYKQRGPEAIRAINVFYYLTYQGNVNLNLIQDPALREAIETQIRHFGQTPSQLTTDPHPPRSSALHVAPLMFSPIIDEVCMVVKFPFNAPIVHIAPCVLHNSSAAELGGVGGASTGATCQSLNQGPYSIVTITSNNQYQINKWHSKDPSNQPFLIDPLLGISLTTPSQHTASSSPATASVSVSTTNASSTNKRQLIDINDMCSGVSISTANDYSNNIKRKFDSKSSQDQQNADAQFVVVDEVVWSSTHYIVTLDGRHIIMGSFYDNSFRVFSTDYGKLSQVIYGHRGPITCMARSECNAVADFYVATGSQDCSVLLWTWNAKYAQIEGSGVSAVHNPMPKLTISGHESPILTVLISAELGLILSGSRNLLLVHTTAYAECLVEINIHLASLHNHEMHFATDNDAASAASSSGDTKSASSNSIIRPYVKDKQRANLEASMLGDDLHASSRSPSNKNKPDDNVDSSSIRSTNGGASTIGGQQSMNSNSGKKQSMVTNEDNDATTSSNISIPESLNSLVRHETDYYVTNIRLARELAFIACLAIPAPTKAIVCTKDNNKATAASSETDGVAVDKRKKKPPMALLLTYNLRGVLMRSTTFGDSNYPKLGDCCILQATRDGEHLILTESPTIIKVIRTFDLQPVYTLNTSNINPANSMVHEPNRVKSLSPVENKYILVGLDNGKLIVYNIDFKNL